MLDRYLALIPKTTLAFLAIVGGILFIVFSDPPRTVCDAQIEVFKNAQKRFLYKDPKSKQIQTTKYEKLIDHCRMTNTGGGCYELFQEVKIFLHDLGAVPTKCNSAIGGVSEVHKVLWDVTDLMVRIAWGDKPPEGYYAKFKWLDTADISLFCSLKSEVINVYGDAQWTAFREKMMTDLPGAKDLPRTQVWEMSIFSENCARYP
jgi:hypothetical protein